MSLALFTDPAGGGSAVTPCAAKTCPLPGRHRVRARLGSRVPTSIYVCNDHRRMLEEAGELEDSMRSIPCTWPDCGETSHRGDPSMALCNKHLQRVGKTLGHTRLNELTREQLDEAIRRWRERAGELPTTQNETTIALEVQASPEAIQRIVSDLPPVVVPTVEPAISHLPSMRQGETRAAQAIRDVLAGQTCDLTALAPELQQVLGRLSLRLRDDSEALDAARLAGMAAEGKLSVLQGQVQRAEEALAPLAERYGTSSIAAIAACAQRDLEQLTAGIAAALNVGPPSASDIPAGCEPKELARIVRARSELMLEERDQRVALALRLEALEKSPLAGSGAEAALVTWLELPGVRDEVLAASVYAVAEQAVSPAAVVEGMHDRVALARLVLTTQLPSPPLNF